MQQSRRFSSLAALSAVRGTTATTSGRISFALRCYSTGDKKPVGFIGLGNMGGFMAQNILKAGYPLVVFDVNKGAVERLTSQGAKAAATPREVASQVHQLVTMLPSSPHVQEVYTSENGIFNGIKEGSLLIDASTIEPAVARGVIAKAAEHKVTMVDAPVSGGVGGAEKGTLTFMVGGSQEEFDRAKPLLSVMGKNIVLCGGAGSGQAVKICNNLVLAISMIGVSEGMNLGVKLGLEPKILAGIFNTSSARCWSSDTYNPVPGVMEGVPASRGYTGGFGVDLMAKDVSLAINAAHGVKAPIPLGAVALQVYNMISTQGGGGKDFSSVFEFFNKGSAPKQ
ncbi:3hydroxyisobutyrate dehydrogenase [Acanthamoeba castellanii str. Neff]|uniref:3-hydroxyisobutyrate dehydrogenase n=1 Tax=Acanthamoeba castellanii (strain ATCC 30010 / Neff) TaxID=1257118 RepID=L8HDI8_ACACF|nr:3hydroxyisobutyrate dehydrogenase [Acanthamoeba castellanii str. Neff]ELR23250.1 3hydroxyisobutyrate dehydrogenase [Acanthamoeba castellanii str. Neff]